MAAGTSPGRPAPRLAIGLMLAIFLDSLVQIVWKLAAAGLGASVDPAVMLAGILSRPLFLLVALLFALQLANWLKVLSGAELSFAQPITATSYVFVAALSALFLGEKIGPWQAGGIALILAGVWLVGGSGRPAGELQP